MFSLFIYFALFSKITYGTLSIIPGTDISGRADLGHLSTHLFLGRQLEDSGIQTTMPHVQYQNIGLTLCVLNRKGESLMRRSVVSKSNLRLTVAMEHRKFSISGYCAPRVFCLYGMNSKLHQFHVSWRHRQLSRQQLIGTNISFSPPGG